MQQTHHLQTLLLPMQHSTYPLCPQNLHLNTPTTVRPKTLDLLPPHTKHHHNPAANKSEPTSTSCTQHNKNPQPRNKQLKILQINVNDIQNKTAELQQLLTQENMDILTIQKPN